MTVLFYPLFPYNQVIGLVSDFDLSFSESQKEIPC